MTTDEKPIGRLLLLDFDGVLHPTIVAKGQIFNRMSLLEEALRSSSIQIVVSSSWRLYESWGYIEKVFPLSLRGLLRGPTGEPFSGPMARWNEIRSYVSEHGVLDWMALDDAETQFPKHCPNLILCDGKFGLQSDQVRRLNEWAMR